LKAANINVYSIKSIHIFCLINPKNDLVIRQFDGLQICDVADLEAQNCQATTKV